MIEAVRRFGRERFGWNDLSFGGRPHGYGWLVWPCGMGESDGVFVPNCLDIELEVKERLLAAGVEYRRRADLSGQKWCGGCRRWRDACGGFTVQFYDRCRECRDQLSMSRHGFSSDDYERKVAYEQAREELLRAGKLEEWKAAFDWDICRLGSLSEVDARRGAVERIRAFINEVAT